MRYRDAKHVDLGSFYARESVHGKAFRFIGYAGVFMACWYHDQPDLLGRLMIALIIAWLMAWYRIVGALWRGPLVAAIFFCAVLVTFAKLKLQVPA
jgi:hypothetical protein